MRSFAITAIVGTGLLGLAPQAQAASHVRPADPQPGRPGAQTAAHGRPAEPQTIVIHARPAEPRSGRPEVQAAPHVRSAEHNARPGVQTAGHLRQAEQQPVHRWAQVGAPSRPGDPQPTRPSYAMHMTGQASHWDVKPRELEVVRWTLINSGSRPLEHVQLVAAIPAGWTVREGKGCTRRGQYLNCELGSLEPGKDAVVLVPMVVQGKPGPVRLAAWSRGTAGSITIPGPTVSFQVVIKR